MFRILFFATVISAGDFELSRLSESGMRVGIPLETSRLSASGTKTIFDAPLTDNGMDAVAAASVAIRGVAAPGVIWWCDDDTGSGTATSGTWTKTGTPEKIDSPFCPDGSHSDLTSGCLQACRFDGANEYYTNDSATPGRCNSADCTVCAVMRDDSTGPAIAVSNREASGAGEGWSIYSVPGSNQITFIVENHAAANRQSVFNTWDPTLAQWIVYCGTHDYDGNTTAYANGAADGAGASPGGTIASTQAITIGAAAGGALDFKGDIVVFAFWGSLLDATDMIEIVEYFSGILDRKSAPVAFTSTADNCCMIDGALECVGDDLPLIGCEIPPGMTGAGSPASGMLFNPALTNQVLRSRGLDQAAWVQSGTPTPTATSTDLFRDGRQTYLITDNDAGARELIQQSFLAHGLSNGTKVQICLYAKGATATENIDIQWYESGGVCSGGATYYNYDSQAVNDSWELYEFTHTITDDTCDNGSLRIAPADLTDVASTGSLETVVQVYFSQSWCPVTYIDTTSSAVAGNDDVLVYDISGTDLANGFADGDKVSFNFTYPATTPDVTTVYFFYQKDSGTATDYYYAIWAQSDEKIYLTARSAEDAMRTMYKSNAAWNPTAGTTYAFEFTVTADATTLTIDGSPVAGTNTTLASAPDSMDDLYIGANASGSAQGGGWIDSFKVTR